MEKFKLLEKQRQELYNMFIDQQKKWINLNNKIIWIVIPCFLSEIVTKLFTHTNPTSKYLLVAMFITAILSYTTEVGRLYYCSIKYFKLSEDTRKGLLTDTHNIDDKANDVTNNSFLFYKTQMILFVMLIIEFGAYAISFTCRTINK